MNNHHYFFAVKLPQEVKILLSEWVESHKEDFPFGRWVHPEDYHITLAFLGYADGMKLQKAIETLGKFLSEERSFSLNLNKLGTFGSEKNPRIFWADVEKSDALNQIQKKVYQQCLGLGFELDKKPFRPHITLARKWMSEEAFDPNKLTKVVEDNSFTVNEIILYETHLDKTPKYKEFASFPLH